LELFVGMRKILKSSITRRGFVNLAAVGVGGSLLETAIKPLLAEPVAKGQIKAILFDGFPIFDVRSVFALVEKMFPQKGVELSNEWRTRQFEYTWLRVVSQRYVDFWQVTEESLGYAAEKVNVEVTPQQRAELMNAYLELKPWPEVPAALDALKKAGYRLGFLSNLTPKMLAGCLRSSGLEGMFEKVLSTDDVKTFKPDPRAYQLGVDSLKLKRESILFVAFAGWDAAGAKSFGYPTFWVNRLKLPTERLGVVPDATGGTLTDVVQYLA